MLFLILLSHNSIRVLKDSLIINELGVEAISFIKLWLEIPFGSLFVIIYYKLCNRFPTEKVFRLVIIFFISFFLIFAFILYPYQYIFHPSKVLVTGLTKQFPNIKWFIIIWSKWSVTLFYIAGELWPIIAFSLLFWELANKIIDYEEAKRFYPYFSFFGQLNLLFAGAIVCYFTKEKHLLTDFFNHSSSQIEMNIKSLITVVAILGMLILAIHYIITYKFILSNDQNNLSQEILKLGTRESFKQIFTSKYLMLICTILISYQICVSLIEGIWFAKAQKLHSSPDAFINYQGKILFWTGIFGIPSALIGGIIVRKVSWFAASIITPVITLVFGGLFFITTGTAFEIFINSSLNILSISIFLGGLQNVLCKSVKYGIFDSTKEMLYIPLDKEMKTKGKAALDVIGVKFGKALGSLSQFFIFTLSPQARIEDIAGILGIIFSIVCVIWILSTRKIAVILSDLNEGKTS